ncbi:uncharacterized protein B0T23DRAFT_422243 [Neurospora hispaniola]|uniref:Uncharacterized protein n=1 Tax=Neurospora hispaniola TaxID=588809 RepID=A0AAJ0I4D5_9PEZI|nr:hypothetical protein B0T23DRAFT_422243 [Neurospora hispaniola]
MERCHAHDRWISNLERTLSFSYSEWRLSGKENGKQREHELTSTRRVRLPKDSTQPRFLRLQFFVCVLLKRECFGAFLSVRQPLIQQYQANECLASGPMAALTNCFIHFVRPNIQNYLFSFHGEDSPSGGNCAPSPFARLNFSSFCSFLCAPGSGNPTPPRSRAKLFKMSYKTSISKIMSKIMEISSSEGVIPATRNNDEEDPAMPKEDPHTDELEVAHDMLLLAQAPSATASSRLPLRRSPSPVADQRISQWRNETRAFKGTITRQSRSVGSAGPAEVARAAQKSALMVDGQPQFVMFCDGSSVYKPVPKTSKDGGYAVVFRDPYDANKAATASASKLATTRFSGPRNEDGISIGDFTIRHWLSHRTYGNSHTEIAALSQALEEVTKRIDQHQPDKSIVKIFTDFDGSLSRVQKGILSYETTTTADSRKRKRELTKKEQADASFFVEHTNPFVQALVWQSHYLSDRGCTIEMHWMPRNTTLGHKLADYMAGQWRRNSDDAFYQKTLPHDQRDGILDKLHGAVGAIERERASAALDSQKPAKKKRKIRRAIGARKKSSKCIALLDSATDYIPLDSESEDKLPPQLQSQKKKQKIDDAIRVQTRSTADYILLDSDSEKEAAPKPQSPNGATTAKQIALDGPTDYNVSDSKSEKQPKPKQEQPPKIEKEIKGTTTVKQRSTRDFILLDSDSEEEPQRPKKRRRIRPTAGAKKASARNYVAVDNPSDLIPLEPESEQKPKPKPQPPKKKKEIKGTTTGKQRSTSDFILLDSDSDEQSEAKRPQTPKKRKKIRGAIPAKKKAPMQQQAEPAAAGFLNGQDHDFAFDSGK